MAMNLPSVTRSAFTLMELLIVITIILILVAMLTPVISMVRAQALRTACMSNLRQVSMVHIAYANDHNGLIPWPPYYTQPDPGVFVNYIESSQLGGVDTSKQAGGHIWCCTVPALNSHFFNQPYTWLYYMNWWALEPYSWPGYQGAHTFNGYRLQTVKNTTCAGICSDLQGGGCGGYHRGYSNVAMLDGHVDTLTDLSSNDPAYPSMLAWHDPAYYYCVIKSNSSNCARWSFA
jgi:prepilin-type N-terminal cleavage/methylation domain-containing protein/prepilin-type processing-associated H-X9-DG protein